MHAECHIALLAPDNYIRTRRARRQSGATLENFREAHWRTKP